MRAYVMIALLAVGCSSGSESTETPADGSTDTESTSGDETSVDTGTFETSTMVDAPPGCPSAPIDDTLATQRGACTFAKGAKVLDTLGVDDATRKKIPITHVVIVVQENRSFDHYFGKLSTQGQPDAEGWPASFSNKDAKGADVKPFHLGKTCLLFDPPHQWDSMRAAWNMGKMDGFVTEAASSTVDGHDVLGYYDQSDLPFYTWLASTFALADHHFPSVLGGTWPNRDFLYAGTSDGVKVTGERTISVPTIFDSLDAAKVSWGVYTDGTPRQDALGWTKTHAGVANMKTFFAKLADGSLPRVVFVDPSGSLQDEHPPNDVQHGEAWTRSIYAAAIKSPLWKELAVFFTYDEAGGLADHVPPPKACLPSADQPLFDQRGFRVPLVVISPYARPHTVSKKVHEHTSILRFVELLHDLPALTARDANADALLDMFDFACPSLMTPPDAPPAGTGGCP